MTTVVITAAGVVLPGANDLDELGAAADAGRSAIAPIERFAPEGYASSRAGVVEDAELSVFKTRLRKRMDRFCTLSMVAARRALADAGLLSADGSSLAGDVDAERVGVYLANMFGGWDITEESMRRLCQLGYTGVSPYVASAWFPTASQGQISIHWGLRGFSKTVIADTASGALALGYAAAAIRDGRADVMLAGGAEASVTPYTHTFCSTSGRMSAGPYEPFRESSDGFEVGEGSVVFVLETLERARERGAPVLAEVAGFATGHAPARDVLAAGGAGALTRVAGQALDDAGVKPSSVGYVGLDAQGRREADDGELAAVRALLGASGDGVTRRTVKPATGHLLGAAAAVELAGAVQALNNGHATAGPALVNARGADGTIACCVLRAAA
jgi:3-oxoacyl-[acyl-carrier-protein] synthase II